MGRSQSYEVCLTKEERQKLIKLTSSGVLPVRELKRAQILLHADRSEGDKTPDWAIAKAFHVEIATVKNTRRKYCTHGLQSIRQKKGAGRPRKLNEEQRAQLVELAHSPTPNGNNRWTLRQLAEELVSKHVVDSLSPQTVLNTLRTSTPASCRQ